MGRKRLIRTHEYPYHITTRSNHRLWFNLPMSHVWKILLDGLHIANEKHPIELHALVCMNNHYHLVLKTPEANIDQFMFELNRNFSLGIRIESRKINKMLGGRYYWLLISGQDHYEKVMKYVFRNPLAAGICGSVEEYPYSTLFKNFDQINFPCEIDAYNDYSSPERIEWLNAAYSENQYSAIKSGLKKSVFQYAQIKGTRKIPTF